MLLQTSGVTRHSFLIKYPRMISRESVEKRRRKGRRMCKLWQYPEEYFTPRNIGRAGRTPVLCSCLMCGNLRRTQKGKERLTMQERRAGLPD
ncbi:MAG: hypothetical protein P4L39_05575 [Humidesulfovibrio sp.]|nr:hypothetical protein [Humidesulfovibrio sp.]